MECFAIFLACIVVFRVFFCILHLLKFKFYTWYYPHYKTFKFDMQQEFAELRANTKNWDESLLDKTDAKLLDADLEARERLEDKDDKQDELLASESFFHMNPNQPRGGKRSN